MIQSIMRSKSCCNNQPTNRDIGTKNKITDINSIKIFSISLEKYKFIILGSLQGLPSSVYLPKTTELPIHSVRRRQCSIHVYVNFCLWSWQHSDLKWTNKNKPRHSKCKMLYNQCYFFKKVCAHTSFLYIPFLFEITIDLSADDNHIGFLPIWQPLEALV